MAHGELSEWRIVAVRYYGSRRVMVDMAMASVLQSANQNLPL
jgi:hypothetical protein